ncbi:MAG: glycoside hydrolase family 172 protein [Planctomycetales bacterium]
MFPSSIYDLSARLQSRAATAENPAAERGRGGTTGDGLKGAPAIMDFRAGGTETLLDVAGPGMVRHIWCTSHLRTPQAMRNLVLRMYWEGHPVPSVEVPLGDFFGVAHGAAVPVQSVWVAMQEGRGFNCFFPMPFARRARITISNETEADIDWFFYQVDFTLGDAVTDEHGRFHCGFDRRNPAPYGEDVAILDTEGARGAYVGCVLGVRPLAPLWWGEGEVKVWLDGDAEHPTICGTGIEDYIGAAWGLRPHGTPYQGAPLVGTHNSLYRFHACDPIYFDERVRVAVQQMGNAPLSEARALYGDRLVFRRKNHPRRGPDEVFYLRSDDYSCTAFWYQYPLVERRHPLPDRRARSADLYETGPQSEPLAEL